MNDPCPKYPNFGYLPNKVEMTQVDFGREVIKIIDDDILAVIAIATAIQEHGRPGGKLRFYGNNWHGAILAPVKKPDGSCYSAWGDEYIGGKFYTDKGEWLIYFNTLEDSIKFFKKHAQKKLTKYIQKYGLKTPGQFTWEDFAGWYIRMWYSAPDFQKAWNEKAASLKAVWTKAVYIFNMIT